MAVTPGLPRIGEKRYQDFVAQNPVDIMLFHDGNQSGHVEKPIQAVDTTDDIVEVNDNIIDTVGDFGFLTGGQAFEITGSTGNDGVYTVDASYNVGGLDGGFTDGLRFDYETEQTQIKVNESITDSTADGTILFGNANRSGRGDNLRDSDDLPAITTEPSDGGYTRATDQQLEINESGGDYFVRTVNDTVFDNLTATTGRVDAVAVLDNWDATGNGTPNDHILFTAFLDQLYLLDQTDRHTVEANTIRLALR